MKFTIQSIFAASAVLLSQVSATPALAARGVGTMTYPLFIKTVPQGLTFTLNSINPVIAGSGTAYSALKQDALPKAFSPEQSDGRIADFQLSMDASGFFGNLGKSGPGASWQLGFNVAGTAFDGTAVNQNGHINIATSDWGVVERPDESIFTFGFDGNADNTFTYETPTLTALDNFLIDIVMDQDHVLAMTITNDADFSSKVAKAAVEGIVDLHLHAIEEWALMGAPH